MKRIEVSVNTWYVVEGAAGSTVINPSTNRAIATVEEGKQTVFYALTPYVLVSDDSVTVNKANFKLAPAKLRALGLIGGGVSALPAGYLAAEFLATTTATTQISTGVEQTRSVGVHTRYLPIGGNPYAMVLTPWVATGKQVRFPTANTQFMWLAQTFYVYGSVMTDAKGNFKESGLLEYNGQTTNITSWDMPAPPGEFKLCNKCEGRFYFATFTEGKKVIAHYIPALELSSGSVGLYDTVRKTFNVLQAGVGMTLAQARKLGKLPEGGGEITVSLPWEAQLDKKVDAALEAARGKGWTIVVQYQEPDTTSAVYNKYATCKTYEDVVAVNEDYKNDLTAAGEWIYPMPEMTRFDNTPNADWWLGFFYKSPIKKIKAVFPKCTYSHAFLGGASNIEEADLEFPIATRVSSPARSIYKLKKLRIVAPLATASDNAFYWNQCRNQDWYIYYPKTKNMQSMFSDCWYIEEIKGEFGMEATNLNYAYKKCPMLRVFPTNYPQAQTADAMFNECQIPGEAAIAVLNSFPAYTSGTHKVTMGIHKDFENDADVWAAIENAEAKGWTVTVQWNGTATAQTASTWGLRRKPIYAKMREAELPDGTTERILDWGHYVTNAEENGYQEFASEEEAKEYFNIGD